VCSRAGKSQWVAVTDVTAQQTKLTKQLQRQQGESEDITPEVEDRLKALSYKKGRRKTSTKCGCKWAVSFSKPPTGEKNPIVRVTSTNLTHTNGCAPSPSTCRKHERRLGRVYPKTLLMQGNTYFITMLFSKCTITETPYIFHICCRVGLLEQRGPLPYVPPFIT
jgi:hypothetical protein